MKKQYIMITALLGAVVLFGACVTPRAAYKTGFDFSKIQTVSIGEFTSVGNEPNSGSVVANEFMRQLLAEGYSVKTGDGADVVLMGNVNEYQPNRRYLINDGQGRGGHGRQQVIVHQPVEMSGSNAYNLGSAFGMGEENKIVVSNATVGISAYLKDVKTGDILWSNSYSYEGLDLSTALDGTVRYLLRSLPRSK